MIALELQSSAALVWLGMVLAISFLEAPLKFRAPGITVALGVGIGRLVFRALNIVETVLFAVILGALLSHAGTASPAEIGLVVALGLDLGAGALLLRPLLDRKALARGAEPRMPRTATHVAYIVLEVLKVALVVALAAVSLAG